MSGGTRKRFWSTVEVAGEAGGFVVRLDGRPLRLPGGIVPGPVSHALAEAVAEEWRLAVDEVGGLFRADDLVLTALVATMQGHVAPEPRAAAGRLAGFAGGDLLCYRATDPGELVDLQTRGWQPWLDWLEATHGVRMDVGHGLMPLRQSDAAIAALEGIVARLTVPVLTGLGVLVPALGSLVLGLAVAAGDLSGEEAYRLARLDEDFQSSHWGLDMEAEAHAARLGRDIALAVRFIRLSE